VCSWVTRMAAMAPGSTSRARQAQLGLGDGEAAVHHQDGVGVLDEVALPRLPLAQGGEAHALFLAWSVDRHGEGRDVRATPPRR